MYSLPVLGKRRSKPRRIEAKNEQNNHHAEFSRFEYFVPEVGLKPAPFFLLKADTRVKRQGIFSSTWFAIQYWSVIKTNLCTSIAEMLGPGSPYYSLYTKNICRAKTPFQPFPPRQIFMPTGTRPNAPNPAQIDGPRILPPLGTLQLQEQHPPYGDSLPSQGHYKPRQLRDLYPRTQHRLFAASRNLRPRSILLKRENRSPRFQQLGGSRYQ